MQPPRRGIMSGAGRRFLAVFFASTTATVANTSALTSTVMMSGGGETPTRASPRTSAAATAASSVGPAVSPVDAAAKDIADRFTARKYRAPWWATNDHFSTIFGSGEIQKKFGVKGPQVSYRRERWNTPDGDFLDVDFLDTPGGDGGSHRRRQRGGDAAGVDVGEGAGIAASGGEGDESTAPFAVLTHGLESTSTAPLTAKMALAYQRKGFRVAVMCFRSCSGEDNLTLRAYHLGFTEDLELVCKTLRERHPRSPLFLSGFSLGGNVITKFLGDLGDRAKEMGIMGGAVACVPFDAVSCQQRVDTGFGKLVYARNFLNSLIPKMMRKSLTDPRVAEVIDLERLQKVTTIGEFDDMVIAPVFGFDDFQDYYRKTQSGQFLKDVRVPFLAVQAINDPFMDPAKLPTVEELQGAPVQLSYHEHGGHCAFLTGSQEENDKGWLATEMARFGDHVNQLDSGDSPA
ncbi:unnamed protein product [Scytosiphon promiscuus]